MRSTRLRTAGLAAVLVGAATLAPAVGPADAAGPTAPPFVSTFGAPVEELGPIGGGGTGDEPGRFNIPQGVAVAPNGQVYVADTYNRRVQQFTPNGTFVREWGEQGTGPGQFASAWSIAVDEDGFVYVVDAGNMRIQKFTATGAYVTEWNDADGNPLVGLNALSYGGSSRRLHVISDAVSGATGVRVFDRDGDFVRLVTFPLGSDPGEVEAGQGVGVAPDNTLYIADTGNDRVQQFTATGTFIQEWGETGSSTGQFDSPTDVTVDAAGDVWVTEGPPNNRVQVFDADGTFKFTFGSSGWELGQFRFPGQVAVSAQGSAYVVEENNNRVSRWARPRTDARIRRGAAGPLAGNNRYNTTGVGQVREARVPGGSTVNFGISIQNDVPAPTAFRVRGQAGTNRFTVRYFQGAQNITAAVLAGTHVTPVVPAGGTRTITARVTVRGNAPPGASLTRLVTVRADADPSRVDAVRFTARRT